MRADLLEGPERLEIPLLEVKDLAVEFDRPEAGPGGRLRAVDGVSFAVGRGEVVGLVGESGCGKSVTALALVALLPPAGHRVAGRVVFEGREIDGDAGLAALRGRGLAYVPQEPGAALNPVLRAGDHVADVLRARGDLGRNEAWEQAVRALARVGLEDERRARQYPHELSGGMRQRVLLAAALAARPRLLLADEPTTAVDAPLAAGLLELLRSLVSGRDLSVLFITHDFGAVTAICDRVLVMYAGRIVEDAPTAALLADPRHPYTRALLASRPRVDVPRGALPAIEGAVPDLAHRPSGCAFHPRCPIAEPACAGEVPALVERTPGHRDACRLTRR